MHAPPLAETIEISVETRADGPAAAVASALEKGLAAAVQARLPGVAVRLCTMNLELTGSLTVGEPVTVRAWVERSTRTLAFVGGEVLCAGARAASGGGVFELTLS